MSKGNSWLESQRIGFIFEMMDREGWFTRTAMARHFGISTATCSMIIGIFLERYPDSMAYDMSQRAFLKSERFDEHLATWKNGAADTEPAQALGFD